jgi:hypothetical protein
MTGILIDYKYKYYENQLLGSGNQGAVYKGKTVN